MNEVFRLFRGDAPLLVSLPHDGSAIPASVAEGMREVALRSPDTDWHVGRLYEFAREMGASMIVPHWSRYLIDLNRPADGHALYPGRAETGLVPTIGFDGEQLYQPGMAPDAAAIADRVKRYWQPYHDALASELARLHAQHGRVVLWEGHSIRGRVPILFEGRLPDFNIGTAGGASCGAALQSSLAEVLAVQDGYSHVLNGRFQGGYITRHYGRPEQGIEAVQLELVQATYMDEESFVYDAERAEPVQVLIRRLLEQCLAS